MKRVPNKINNARNSYDLRYNNWVIPKSASTTARVKSIPVVFVVTCLGQDRRIIDNISNKYIFINTY